MDISARFSSLTSRESSSLLTFLTTLGGMAFLTRDMVKYGKQIYRRFR